MIATKNSEGTLTKGGWQPAKSSLGEDVILEPIVVTAQGSGSVVVENTYDYTVERIKICGKSEQDGTPSPDNPVEIQSVGGTVTVRGRNLVSPDLFTSGTSASVVAASSNAVTMRKTISTLNTSTVIQSVYLTAGQYTASIGSISSTDGLTGGHALVSDSSTFIYNYSSSGARTISFSIDESGYYSFRIYANYRSETGTELTYTNIQLERGADVTDYQPYYEPTTIDLPDLYAVGDVQDVMYVDRTQGRAWVERYIDPDLLVDTAPVDEQTGAVLDEAVIEELEYSEVPTFPRHTTIIANGNATPEIEVTALAYRLNT